MEILIKTFEELSINELYGILQLRAEVFVVEQHCVYQDLDGKLPIPEYSNLAIILRKPGLGG